MYTQNLTTIDSVGSEIICLIKIRSNGRQMTDRQTDGNGRPISSYSRGLERSRKYKSRQSADEFDYNTSLGYAQVPTLPDLSRFISDIEKIWTRVHYPHINFNIRRTS